MFGRALLRLPVRSRLLRQSGFQWHDSAGRTPALIALRAYATPGRPKSVVGEPSRPVKRSVKKAAAKPRTGTSAAEKKTASRKRKASAKAKKPAPKKLTQEQKDAKKAKTKLLSEAARKRELKATALKMPKISARLTPWIVFNTEKMQGTTSVPKGVSQEERTRALAQQIRESAAEFKNLSAAELEHYNHLANQKKEAAHAEYKRWVESHSPQQIYAANQARATLRRMSNEAKKAGRRATSWPPIEDERSVKRPISSYAQFAVNRHASGDLRDISLAERSKLISQEWKALDQQEKAKYERLFSEDLARYKSEFRSTYGRDPPGKSKTAATN